MTPRMVYLDCSTDVLVHKSKMEIGGNVTPSKALALRGAKGNLRPAVKTCEVFKASQVSVVEKRWADGSVQKLTKLCRYIFSFLGV